MGELLCGFFRWRWKLSITSFVSASRTTTSSVVPEKRKQCVQQLTTSLLGTSTSTTPSHASWLVNAYEYEELEGRWSARDSCEPLISPSVLRFRSHPRASSDGRVEVLCSERCREENRKLMNAMLLLLLLRSRWFLRCWGSNGRKSGWWPPTLPRKVSLRHGQT